MKAVHGQTIGNFAGLAALTGWSLSVAFTRRLGEADSLGIAALSYIVSGLLLIFFDRIGGERGKNRAAADPVKFWGLAGGAFTGYSVLFVVSLAWSRERDVVLPLGLVNYFWPGLTLLLMPWFFRCRLRWLPLAAGFAISLAGVGTAMLWDLPLGRVLAAVSENWPAFVLMLAAAGLWGFYSNAARKWGGDACGIGWFQLVAGAVLLGWWGVKGGPLGWTPEMAVPFLVHAVVVNALAYRLWETGIRRGDLSLLGAAANALPLASMLVGGWYFGEGLAPGLWLGGLLVGIGAVLFRHGVSERG